MKEEKRCTIKSETEVWVGDLCYVLSRNMWDQLLNRLPNDGSYEGKVTLEKGGKTYEAAILGTAYGDGGYPGSDGFEYGVDSGTIGVCPVELIDDADDYDLALGRTFKANGEIDISRDSNGTILVETPTEYVYIQTGYEDEEIDDYFDEDDFNLDDEEE